jgi:hypothetical protein
MKLTDEELMAYADGELTPLEAKRIEAAMAEDAALAARVARFRSVRSALRKAYDSVVSEPVPEHLRALLGDVAASEPAPVADLDAERGKRTWRLGPPAWAAIAASLVVGVLAGRSMTPQPLLDANGLYAGPTLTRVLDQRLASAPENQTATTRIGLTFRTEGGDVCRTFSHEARERVVSGMACRVDERWAIRMALTDPAANAEYRQAGAPAPGVLEAVDEIIAGEPLDAEQERALRENRWR